KVINILNGTIDNFKEYEEKAKYNASILSNMGELKQYIAEEDNLKASQFLVQLASEIGLDLIVIVDQNKKLLSRTDQPSRYGDDLSDDYMVKSGLAGYRAIDTKSGEDKIIIQSVAPIKSDVVATGIETLGVIITQYNIGQGFMNDIKKTNEVEVMLYINDQIMSTLIEEDSSDFADMEESLRLEDEMIDTINNTLTPQFEKKKIQGIEYSIASTAIVNNRNIPVGIISIAAPMEEVVQAKAYTTQRLMLICALGVFFGISSGIFISKNIVDPLRALVKDTKIIANGDLTYQVNEIGNDELGQLTREFNSMSDSLRNIVYHINNTFDTCVQSSNQLTMTIEKVQKISTEVEQISSDMKRDSIHQAQHLDEASHDMANVLLSTADISKQTNTIAKYTQKVNETAIEGEKSLHILVDKISSTKEAIHHTSNKIYHFKENLNQIVAITHFIQTIAKQTNLLSLNATIEAARAGEAGRGFSVVADEIRGLSEQSNQSVSEINDIIKSLFDDMESTASVVEDSVSHIESSNDMVVNTNESFQLVIQSIDEVNNMIQEILQKSEMQVSNINHTNTLIERVKGISCETEI
ncbi:MAG TPA: methyl-accepting chemotaxis protein, partial [Clostridiales bacterium]|nr:methyl-accepting chemotaxis protein [Clostridiales bacterium]